jgi:hypothetical protein
MLIQETLKLTPLRICNVPPPMCSDTLHLESAIIHVSFDVTGKYFAILREGYVDIATWKSWKPHCIQNSKIICTVELPDFSITRDILKQIVLLDENTFAVICDNGLFSSTLSVLHRPDPSKDFELLHCIRNLQRIVRLFSSERELLCEMADGTINNLESILNNTSLFTKSEIENSALTFPLVAATIIGDQVPLFLHLLSPARNFRINLTRKTLHG